MEQRHECASPVDGWTSSPLDADMNLRHVKSKSDTTGGRRSSPDIQYWLDSHHRSSPVLTDQFWWSHGRGVAADTSSKPHAGIDVVDPRYCRSRYLSVWRGLPRQCSSSRSRPSR